MDLGPWEIAIIAVVILVLFGSAKLPQAARSLGTFHAHLQVRDQGPDR